MIAKYLPRDKKPELFVRYSENFVCRECALKSLVLGRVGHPMSQSVLCEPFPSLSHRVGMAFLPTLVGYLTAYSSHS